MSIWRQWFLPMVAFGLVLAAFGWLFQVRLGGGDVYPEYSSLRADALGTRAFYEALAQVPGIQVQRDYRPLAQLSAQPRLIVLPGLRWQNWQSVPANELAALNAAVSNGARVVLAFRAELKRDNPDSDGQTGNEEEQAKEKAAKEAKSAKEVKKKKLARRDEKIWEPKELAKAWGVTLKQRWLVAKQPGAQRVDDAPAGLPPQVAWHGDMHFAVTPASGWHVLYRCAGEPVLVEKAVGRGSIVLLADAYCLSNEAMDRDRATALLSYLVGDFRRVDFVESPLGVLEDNGLGYLARRYGLGGALALCVLLGVLYAWRRLVPFRPAQEEILPGRAETLTYEPAAGFTGLLRRSLGATEVLPTCMEEWRKARRSGGRNPAADARVEAAWQTREPKQSVSATYNTLVRALKSR